MIYQYEKDIRATVIEATEYEIKLNRIPSEWKIGDNIRAIKFNGEIIVEYIARITNIVGNIISVQRIRGTSKCWKDTELARLNKIF